MLQMPMDLSTMIKKAKKHKYSSEEDLLDDFSLIVDNCIEYNGADSGESCTYLDNQILSAGFRHLKSVPFGLMSLVIYI